MNIFKTALRHIQAVLPKSWHKPTALAQVGPSIDRFEVLPAPRQRQRAPTIDWAEIDRGLPQGDPLQVMDEVLGSSARYSVVRGSGFYLSNTSTSTTPSVVSLLPLEQDVNQSH